RTWRPILLGAFLVRCKSMTHPSNVQQDPPSILGNPEGPTTIKCSHSIDTYNVILWYQKPIGDSALKLIGYVYYTNPTLEDEFKDHFNVTGDGTTKAELSVQKLQPEDNSAMYFCASSTTVTSEAIFGGGTKLTVLDPNITIKHPNVTVLQPSEKECKGRDGKKKKTLVCVASDFYPDHVSVFWQLNGQNITNGVATDINAKRDGKYYKITSRLKSDSRGQDVVAEQPAAPSLC
uniref:Ig-like domain-containing protein n=1 Tax=Fundulus heteroclitus TaxID=8078 RepID=A0A3Q2QJ98_FUNHE